MFHKGFDFFILTRKLLVEAMWNWNDIIGCVWNGMGFEYVMSILW